MDRYTFKRCLTIIPVLAGISIGIFSFIHLLSGDPVVRMLGKRATPERVKDVCLQHGQNRSRDPRGLLSVKL